MLEKEVNLVGPIYTRVWSPQTKERLCYAPFVIFSRPSVGFISLIFQISFSGSLGKDLHDWYFIFHGYEKGIKVRLKKVDFQFLSCICGGAGMTSRDSSEDRHISYTDIMAEVTLDSIVSMIVLFLFLSRRDVM